MKFKLIIISRETFNKKFFLVNVSRETYYKKALKIKLECLENLICF